MNVLLFLLIAASFFPPFSRLSAESPSSPPSVPIADHPYLTLHYSIGGNIVKLKPGMSKKNVDQLLGTGITYRTPAFDYDKHGDLIIAYENDQAVYFSVEGGKASLNGTIDESSAREDVERQLGSPSLKETGEYLFRETDGEISQIKPNENVAGIEESSLYRLKFYSSHRDEIYSFSIERGDFKPIADDRVAAMNSHIVRPDKTKPFTMWDLSVQADGGKGRVAIGMSKTSVDKLLGDPGTRDGFAGKFYVYEGAEVYYRNKKAVAILIRLDEDFTKIYRTPRGLGLLTDFEGLVKLYGQPTHVSDKIIDYSFYKKKDGLGKMTETTSPLEIPPIDQRYYMSFILTDDESKLISYILISDHEFAYTGR
ncbi:hypothetical protein FPL14_18760 [Cohnella cholangitidis]|uniref:Uncharacterized protein n=2 Tax=Cohnella cholangitidis TaxID=2598458 RepID=A0A7G5C1B1_9BACL|nr:hypothetical protein FPL14_18760 [Cohnella cholangitidis]